LELGDREFQEIHDKDQAIKAQARQRVEAGDLTVELVLDAVKTYLDRTATLALQRLQQSGIEIRNFDPLATG
jgi:hypothetical protein